MKAEIREWDRVFAIELKAETMQEAAIIARFGVNSLKEVVYKEAFATKEGGFILSLSIARSRKPTAAIGK